mgnify:CR=1 FL=1|tara:strand:+ start:241 stop:381 length:141 start_codon:yes stop_codon:yes gene_type:complete
MATRITDKDRKLMNKAGKTRSKVKDLISRSRKPGEIYVAKGSKGVS